MTLIGMNVDLGDALASAVSSQSGDIRTQLITLHNTVDTLLATWHGNSRITFENEWTPWVTKVNSVIEAMEAIHQRLKTTVENFRSVDCF